ncbi:helix-turn-helix domain-containing protein [Halogeometricum sp. S1BR25-6]|uniref:Helix-turn-helix domain-containing protein n=1 Tax=Halogeometricum salsisoli TaxID=2950536 RepID=A0ABU2GJ39_9EURY|nr:helix-turn-helix domain-containing protein [Halogeometricum sp. S1BR25-6]MDS0300820.1 helix-turn-helix domain-containing protein [Halogeometricum sp. S1BR25-6]
MREFEFVVTFERGADDLMDLFFEYPALTTRSSTCFTTHDRMWRIDHVRGEKEALASFDDLFLDEDRCNECFDVVNCDTARMYHVLDRKTNARTVYTYREEVHRCHSIPHHVVDHLGDGVVFESRRTDGEYRWRILYPGEQPIGDLYDAIESDLREGLALEVSHLSRAGNWDVDSRVAAQLSPAHWEVLETAVEHGYYSRPRDVTVAELASLLDAPRSTVQYRLRTAEDLIVEQFVDAAL